MCWAYRTAPAATSVVAVDAAFALPHVGRITCAGRSAAVMTYKGGKMRWLETRYGMMLPVASGRPQLIWNARDDKLKEVETWSRLIRQRFAVPVDAYVETTETEDWHIGPTGWMVGHYDVEAGGGSVTITEDGPHGRMPILLDERGASAWLRADQWDALSTLASGRRVTFEAADIFTSKSLSTDARTKVPLAKAA